MMMLFRATLTALPLVFASPAWAQQPAPVADLVAKIDIPYQQFTLPNGLRVLVHTDRKAPVVAVSIWYHVGSKDEPAGKTGFAHLFEHLMFNGSENSPGDFFEPLQQVGATDYNGTTWFDRTNYFQTVPTGALDKVLWLESDRMGYLLGAVTQEKLDNQIGVVQNEKRQGDNQPFGQVEYLTHGTLFPKGHPYHHSTIGSMADLSAASLTDTKDWFRAKYGAGNAILVLAGDIDVATAREKVTKYFGAIARGPKVTQVKAPIPTLSAPVTKTLKDKVPYTRVMRQWAVPGLNGRDTSALQVGMSVLGGLASSRLQNALVRDEKIAVGVSASVQTFEKIGVLTIQADVKPGEDAGKVAARLDTLIADFKRTGPTADEMQRVATKTAAGTIGGLEQVGGFTGKAVTLAEGLIYSNDPAFYKKELANIAAMTPARVTKAMQRWLNRPVFNLTIEPGERDTSAAMLEITGDAPSTRPKPAPVKTEATKTTPRPTPEVGTLAGLDFPAIERTTLSNGMPVIFARRTAVPTVRMSISFDAGFSSDPQSALGTQSLMLAVLDEGTKTRNSVQIAEEQERLGASISSGASLDRTSVTMFALTPNLGASLGLLADIVRNPAFDPREVERLRGQQLARIKGQLSSPEGVAGYLLPSLLYGRGHPYGVPSTGTGEAASVAKISRDALVAFHSNWIRPDNAQIFVVGNTTLEALKPQLEATFGNWAAPATPKPAKLANVTAPTAANKIYLVDRPGSGQSVIQGGVVLNRTGKDDNVLLTQGNDVLGGSFLSRINMDLRETKGWSYGAGGGPSSREGQMPYLFNAPVQADRTGDSLIALNQQLRDFLGKNGVMPAELERTRNGSIRELPGSFETSSDVLGAMQRIVWLGRPDDFYEGLPARYRAMSATDLDNAVRTVIDPAKITWLVVGDAEKVRPQLEKVGLPIETLPSPAAQ
jgi:zinc protease